MAKYKMNKIIIYIAIMLAFLIVPNILLAEEPDHKAIDFKFFKCDRSRDLRGGIYGKGPFKSFGASKSDCTKKEWVEITKEEFKALATKWYGYRWENEIPFWKESEKKP